jgi:hypothetical protein
MGLPGRKWKEFLFLGVDWSRAWAALASPFLSQDATFLVILENYKWEGVVGESWVGPRPLGKLSGIWWKHIRSDLAASAPRYRLAALAPALPCSSARQKCEQNRRVDHPSLTEGLTILKMTEGLLPVHLPWFTPTPCPFWKRRNNTEWSNLFRKWFLVIMAIKEDN